MARTKEVRNGNLIATIKTNLPNVGHVKLDTNSHGRKAFCKWRGLDFLISSRLVVKEMGFGLKGPSCLLDSPDAQLLQGKLKTS